MHVLRHTKDFVWGAKDYVKVGRDTPRALNKRHPLWGLSCSVHIGLGLNADGCPLQDIFLSLFV